MGGGVGFLLTFDQCIQSGGVTYVDPFADVADDLMQFVKNTAVDTSGMTDEELDKHQQKVLSNLLGLTDTVAALFGIPLKNIRRDADALINTYQTATNGLENNATSTWNAALDGMKDATPIWGWLPDKTKCEMLYDAVVSGDDKYRERIESTYKDQSAVDSAYRKALRECHPRIRAAAEAYLKLDYERYADLLEDIIAEGNFDRSIIIAAAKAEINALKPEDD